MENIKNDIVHDIDGVNSVSELNDLKVKYVGKKGIITLLYAKMKDISNGDKKEYGMKINELKGLFNEKYEDKKNVLEKMELSKRLASEKIDVTLPGTKPIVGAPNILEKIIEEVEEVFMSMGYDVVDGPEIEEDKFNFEMLNIPKGHPARDAQDTFYIEDENILLRSQTSPVQVRTMLEAGGNKPVRVICPGKTYRRDDDDATHSHQFMQCEGLVIGENITVADLKGTLELMIRELFKNDAKIRFRPSYFPFTEPSFEVDMTCHNCGGKGCPICKGTGWIEILGSGMVHPNVLEAAGIDSKKYTGFAFGVGIERVAMLKYGIMDIRDLYANDLRFLNGFKRGN